MADVQWIRLIVGMFDGNSFKKIKRARIGGVPFRDKLTAVWFELLDLAGKSNANGYLIDHNEIPYRSFEDIAIQLDRDEKEIELCMEFFLTERMVEIVNNVYCLSNFTRYQNQDGLDKIREQNRLRQAKFKQKQKLLASNVTVTLPVTLGNAIEEERDKEKESHSFIHSDESAYIDRKVEESELEGEDAEVYRRELQEGLKLKYIQGSLGQGVVLMSDEQFDDLCSKYSIEEIDKYMAIIVDCEKSGKRYKKKTHYQAIIDMATKDRRIST